MKKNRKKNSLSHRVKGRSSCFDSPCGIGSPQSQRRGSTAENDTPDPKGAIPKGLQKPVTTCVTSGACTAVTVALIQTRSSPDVESNLIKTLAKISKAADNGAQIICLQELFRSLYFPQKEDAINFELAEPIPGPTTTALCEIARKKKVVIVGSIFEKRTQGIYHNTAIVIDADGMLLGLYRKMHIPDDPCFYEKFYFTPGDLGFRTFQTQYAKIGALICWDQWFPEAARLTALSGAQIIFYPTAIGWHLNEKAEICKNQHAAWETIQRSHAIANGVYLAAVNRVGQEGELKFWGSSFVSDPFGQVIARAHHEKEQIVTISCDLKKIEEIRHEWPFLRDRRIDAYEGIMSRYLDSGPDTKSKIKNQESQKK